MKKNSRKYHSRRIGVREISNPHGELVVVVNWHSSDEYGATTLSPRVFGPAEWDAAIDDLIMNVESLRPIGHVIIKRNRGNPRF